MVIDMDETKLRTIEQLKEFLAATPLVAFSGHGEDAGDGQRYAHVSRVLKRFDYPQRNKRERGVVLRVEVAQRILQRQLLLVGRKDVLPFGCVADAGLKRTGRRKNFRDAFADGVLEGLEVGGGRGYHAPKIGGKWRTSG